MKQTSDLEELEHELATLFIGNKRSWDILFVQELIHLLIEFPHILEMSLKVPKNTEHSFLLILLEKVFNYSVVYQHPTYQPYIPGNKEELECAGKVLDLHFPHLAEVLKDFFDSACDFSESQIPQELPASGSTEASGADEPTEQIMSSPSDSPEEASQELSDDAGVTLEDPGVSNEILHELITLESNEEDDLRWPEEFVSSIPITLKPVIFSMATSLTAFHLFKNSSNAIIHLKTFKLQPHHHCLRILIALDYCLNMGQEQVEDEQEPLSWEQHHETILGLGNIFSALHPKQNMEAKDWEFRILNQLPDGSGILCLYSSHPVEYQVTLDENGISVKETEKMKAMKSLQQKQSQKPKKKTPAKIPGKPDPGLRDDILWELYQIRPQKHEFEWPLGRFGGLPGWCEGLLVALERSKTIYSMFEKQKSRCIHAGGRQLQPHHGAVLCIIAAEYLWQLNVREVQPHIEDPKEFDAFIVNQLKTIQSIFWDLLPESHSIRETGSEQWSFKRTGKSGGAQKIQFEFIWGEEHKKMEITSKSLLIRT